MVIVTPARLAVAFVINPIAVLVSVWPMIVRSRGDYATREAHKGSERTQYSYPMKSIHSLVLLEVVASRNDT